MGSLELAKFQTADLYIDLLDDSELSDFFIPSILFEVTVSLRYVSVLDPQIVQDKTAYILHLSGGLILDTKLKCP